MGRKRKSFEHESIQDCASVLAYLRALTAGIEQGRLILREGQEEFVLEPEGLLTLNVRASRKRNRRRLDLRLSWRDEEQGPEPLEIDASPLVLDSDAPASEETS